MRVNPIRSLCKMINHPNKSFDHSQYSKSYKQIEEELKVFKEINEIKTKGVINNLKINHKGHYFLDINWHHQRGITDFESDKKSVVQQLKDIAKRNKIVIEFWFHGGQIINGN